MNLFHPERNEAHFPLCGPARPRFRLPSILHTILSNPRNHPQPRLRVIDCASLVDSVRALAIARPPSHRLTTLTNPTTTIPSQPSPARQPTVSPAAHPRRDPRAKEGQDQKAKGQAKPKQQPPHHNSQPQPHCTSPHSTSLASQLRPLNFNNKVDHHHFQHNVTQNLRASHRSLQFQGHCLS